MTAMERQTQMNSESETNLIRCIPRTKIRRSDQPRTHFDASDMEDLAASIEEVGQQTPIVVKAIADDPKHDYELVEGERRWIACGITGVETMLVLIENAADTEEPFVSSVAGNFDRSGRTALEIAQTIDRTRNSKRLQKCSPSEQVARLMKIFARSEPWIYQHLAILRLHPEVQAMMAPTLPKEQRIGYALGLVISTLPRDLQLEIAKEMKAKKMTLKQARIYTRQIAEEAREQAGTAKGVFTFIDKPSRTEENKQKISPTLREEPRQEIWQAPVVIIGTSQEAKRMREFSDKAAATEHTILLRGETGVGKDHLADVIHNIGRRKGAFVPVDCGALTESLSEAELFGHARGAFTDAHSDKQGLVKVAEDGTLFFNEVANMSLSLQAKFLRVLEKKTFRPVGGTRETPVNTRIIAATNANLELAVRRGELRSDLYHRLNTITFVVVPLRDRSEDIPGLAEYFLRQEQVSKNFSPEAMAVLMGYHWPGNVRELKNAVVRAAFHSAVKEDIKPEHIHPYLTSVGDRGLPTLYKLQQNYLRDVLRKTKGGITKGAEIAGISAETMTRKIQKFQLEDFVDSLRGDSIN